MAQPFRPCGRRAADQQSIFEAAGNALEAFHAVFKGAVVEEHLRPDLRGAVAAQEPEVAIE